MKRLVFGLAALGLLAGCGIPGGLERPDPMWNSEEAIQRECTRELERGETRDPRCAQSAPFIYDAANPGETTAPAPRPQ